MSFSYRLVNRIIGACAASCVVSLVSCIKISFIVGSSCAFFSGSSIAMPLMGVFGPSLSILTFLAGYVLHGVMGGGWVVSYLVYHIPGLCAAASWSYNNLIMRFLVPVSCMALFIVHPVGGQAWAYSLYWLIPMVIYALQPRALFYNALACTFIAHAVGSVIWLYTMTIPAQMWLGLIPVVAVERLLFASGIVVGCYVMSGAQAALVKSKKWYTLFRF